MWEGFVDARSGLPKLHVRTIFSLASSPATDRTSKSRPLLTPPQGFPVLVSCFESQFPVASVGSIVAEKEDRIHAPVFLQGFKQRP